MTPLTACGSPLPVSVYSLFPKNGLYDVTAWNERLRRCISSKTPTMYVTPDKPAAFCNSGLRLRPEVNHVSWNASGNGNGRSSIVFTTLKTAVLAAMPRARITMAVIAKERSLRRVRSV